MGKTVDYYFSGRFHPGPTWVMRRFAEMAKDTRPVVKVKPVDFSRCFRSRRPAAGQARAAASGFIAWWNSSVSATTSRRR